MSERNGDKARFGRLRKQKMARRQRIRDLRERLLVLLCHKSSAQTTAQRAAGKLLHQEPGDPDTQCGY